MRRVLSLMVVGVLAASGCGGSAAKQPAGPSDNGAIETGIDRNGATGPLAGLVVAHGVTRQGAVVRPGIDYLAGARQIVAVVHVGAIAAPAPLIVTWSRLGRGARALFRHRITVHAGARAYSTAVSPGRLLAGRYRVSARLHGDEMTTLVMVSDEPPSRAERTLQGAEPAVGPPTSGPSGILPAQGAGTVTGAGSGGGCALTASADPSGANTVVTVDATGCSGNTFAVTAGPTGTETPLGTFTGDITKYLNADPCKVKALDTPGSEIRYEVRATSGPQTGLHATASTKVGEDVTPPEVAVTTDPVANSQVNTGDKIHVHVDAVDRRTGSAAAAGVEEIRLDAEGTTKSKAFPKPKSCGESQLQRAFDVDFAVPADTGDFFRVDVLVPDFAGNKQRLTLMWPTHTLWRGLVTLNSVANGKDNHCTAKYEIDLKVLVKNDGKVYGYGDVATVSGPTCTYGFVGPGPSGYAVSVRGTFDKKTGFRFKFMWTGGSGFEGGLHLLWTPVPREVSLHLAHGNAFAIGEVHGHARGGQEGAESDATLDGEIPLLCESC